MAGKGDWYNHEKSMQSCALAGAAAMVAGITDSVMIANGPAWCYFYAMRVVDRPGLDLGQRFRCTYPSNGAVVFGTEKEVVSTLSQLKAMEPQPGLVLLENSCALSLIGDDLQGMADSVELGCPVLTLDSGGLLGDYWQGYTKALQSLLKLVEYDDCASEPLAVNLIGCSSSYYNEADDVEELKNLLSRMGLQVHLVIGLGHTMDDLKSLKKAALNIVVHSELGLAGAKWLQEKLHMPYIAPILPYGLRGIHEWCGAVAEALAEPEVCAGYERIIQAVEEEKKRNFEHLKELQRLWGEPWFDRVLLAGPGSVLQGMERVLLSEWLDAGEVTFVYHDSKGQYPAHYHNVQSDTWQGLFDDFDGGLLLGSNHEKKFLQEKHGSLYGALNIAAPVNDEVYISHRPFMGFAGNRRMTEALWNLHMQGVQKQTLL